MEEKRVDVRTLISRLGASARALQTRIILAPVVPSGRVRTRLDGLIHEFRLARQFTGWGRFRLLNERTVEYVGEALPWEREAYLGLFPSLCVILLWPAGTNGAWWAMPANAGEAWQRFRLPAEPVRVLLVDPAQGAARFETVVARADGRLLWFGGLDALADPLHAAWLRDADREAGFPARYPPGLPGAARQALLLARLRRLEEATAADAARRLDAIRAAAGAAIPDQTRHARRDVRQHDALLYGADRLEHYLRRALERADAELIDFAEVPAGNGMTAQISVEWRQHGQEYRYRSLVDRDLTVVSSGICLSGRDGDFDLTSLVSVMLDA